jgi:hypothetical protein
MQDWVCITQQQQQQQQQQTSAAAAVAGLPAQSSPGRHHAHLRGQGELIPKVCLDHHTMGNKLYWRRATQQTLSMQQ